MLIIVTLKSLSDNSSISVSFESDDYLDSFFLFSLIIIIIFGMSYNFQLNGRHHI